MSFTRPLHEAITLKNYAPMFENTAVRRLNLPKSKANGKPVTWFPPEGLVEFTTGLKFNKKCDFGNIYLYRKLICTLNFTLIERLNIRFFQ